MHPTIPQNESVRLRPLCMVSPGEGCFLNRQPVRALVHVGLPFLSFRPTNKLYPSAFECNRPLGFRGAT